MKVFFFESPNEINSIFGEMDYNVPFLGSTLLKFNTMNLLRNGERLGEPVELYTPNNWELESELFKGYTNVLEVLHPEKEDKYELILMMSVFSIMVGDFNREHITTLKQNPDTMYQNNGVIFGYGKEFSEPTESKMLDNFKVLSVNNFLQFNSALVGQLNIESVKTDARTFGKPVIMSENINNSTVCGPCFIGKDVFIAESYIGPGTIITGNSSIVKSKVLSSFVDTSSIQSSEIEDTITSGASLNNLNVSNSILPLGSTIKNERKI